MKILAIDPGNTESAWVLWDGEMILGRGKVPNNLMVATLRKGWTDPDVLPPARCVIEQIASYGMAVGAEIFETCVWTGRFLEAFGADRCDRIPRLRIKQHLCHDSRAKDQNIRAALIDRFGGPLCIKKGGVLRGVSGDVWAALAVAVTWFDLHVGKVAA